MACLYCGKELGPLQLLRSEEYCSAAHRKLYQERLGRVLDRIRSEEPQPTRLADFTEISKEISGNSKQFETFEFEHGSPDLRFNTEFPLTIPPVLGERAARLREPEIAEAPEAAPVPAEMRFAALPAFQSAMPAFALAAIPEDPSNALAIAAALNPPPPRGYVPVPAAEPVVCDVMPAVSFAWQQPATSLRYPEAPAFEHVHGAPALARQEQFAPAGEAEAVEFPLTWAVCEELMHAPIALTLPAPLQCVMEAAPVAAAMQSAFGGEAPIAGPKPSLPAAAAAFACAIPAVGELLALPAAIYLPAPPKRALQAAAVPGQSADSLAPQSLPLPACAISLPLAGIASGQLLNSSNHVQLPAAVVPELVTTDIPSSTGERSVAKAAGPAAARSDIESEAAMEVAPPMPKISIPSMAGRKAKPGLANKMPSGAPCEFLAEPVESMPQRTFALVPRLETFALQYPQFALHEQEPAAAVAEMGQSGPAVAVPPLAAVSPAALTLMQALELRAVQSKIAPIPGATIPPASAKPLEFYCKRVNSLPVLSLSWMMPVLTVRPPRLQISAVLEPLEQPVAVPLPPQRRKKDPAAEIFQMPEARRRPTWLREIAKPIAASLLVGGFLWLTVTAMHVGTHTAAVNRDVSTFIQAERELPAAATEMVRRQASSRAQQAAPAESSGPGLMARMRQAVSSRAASQITESFRTGMAAWGDGHKSGIPSWQRNAEGFVRPSSFALFRPSLDYRDYRMEFFGQIEQKSMSWAVRAHDPKNYYGMKFVVVEPGIRPMVALEHYAVVDGKKSGRTQVPLPELMFHNNTPYHLEVSVRGNRVTTSVEGQEVDSWLDDALPTKGGVGFFAEAGERARLYWMKVARNEDFLGRICAYLSGSDGAATSAELWPGTGMPSRPGSGSPFESPDMPLAAAFVFSGSQQRRRSAQWKR